MLCTGSFCALFMMTGIEPALYLTQKDWLTNSPHQSSVRDTAPIKVPQPFQVGECLERQREVFPATVRSPLQYY